MRTVGGIEEVVGDVLGAGPSRFFFLSGARHSQVTMSRPPRAMRMTWPPGQTEPISNENDLMLLQLKYFRSALFFRFSLARCSKILLCRRRRYYREVRAEVYRVPPAEIHRGVRDVPDVPQPQHNPHQGSCVAALLRALPGEEKEKQLHPPVCLVVFASSRRYVHLFAAVFVSLSPSQAY